MPLSGLSLASEGGRTGVAGEFIINVTGTEAHGGQCSPKALANPSKRRPCTEEDVAMQSALYVALASRMEQARSWS
eukprot:1155599-Pelagomonas_calceolata.AAC.3